MRGKGIAILKDILTGRLIRECVGVRQIPFAVHVLPAGIECLLAPDLVAQRVTPDGRILATRGYDLYEATACDTRLRRVTRLPCPFGKAKLAHFSVVRRHVHRSDIVTVFESRSGALIALSGGYLYRRGADEKKFQRVFKLRYWGPGVGCGFMSGGIAQVQSGEILFGEYFGNRDYVPVHIYASADDGRSWQLAHAFGAGEIRHVHSLLPDPVTGELWVCTGDADDMSFVAFSKDDGRTFQRLGQGSQQWRVCRVFPTEQYIYWGADTNDPALRSVYRISRQTKEIEKLADVGGPVIGGVRLAEGTFVLATDREGMGGMVWMFGDDTSAYRVTEWDDIPSLWISLDGIRWKRLKMTPWLQEAKPTFGMIKVAPGDGANYLAFTCINMEKYNNSLVVIAEKELRRWYESAPDIGRTDNPEAS